MQNLKQTLEDRGLTGSLLLRENGMQISLRFEKGQTKKTGKLTLGATSMDVEFVLEEVAGAAAEHPNLRLVLQTGAPQKISIGPAVQDPPPVESTPIETAAPTITTTTSSGGDSNKYQPASANKNSGGQKKGN